MKDKVKDLLMSVIVGTLLFVIAEWSSKPMAEEISLSAYGLMLIMMIGFVYLLKGIYNLVTEYLE